MNEASKIRYIRVICYLLLNFKLRYIYLYLMRTKGKLIFLLKDIAVSRAYTLP